MCTTRGGEESAGRTERRLHPLVYQSMNVAVAAPHTRRARISRRATCSGPSARAPRHRRRRAVPSSLCPSLPASPHSASRPGGIQPRGRRLSPRCTHGPGLLFSFVCFLIFLLTRAISFFDNFRFDFLYFFFFLCSSYASSHHSLKGSRFMDHVSIVSKVHRVTYLCKKRNVHFHH